MMSFLLHLSCSSVVIFATSLMICTVCLILCIWRKRSSSNLLDESSSLLSRKVPVTGTSFSMKRDGYDHALMSVHYYLRDKPGMEFTQAYKPADRSTSTYWFLVKDKSLSNLGCKKAVIKVTNIIRVLPMDLRNEGTGTTILDVLHTVKDEMCPFLWSVLDLKFRSERENLLVLSKFSPEGSLRDRMLGAKPFQRLQKTVRFRKSYEYAKPLSMEKICAHTKQVLLGLIFLDELNYPLRKTHLWLHSGNVLLDKGVCKLSGYELELLYLKDVSSENENRVGLNSVAQLVFEMATGFPVNYADHMNMKPAQRRLTVQKKDKLRELHFDYLNKICKPEIVQLLQFLCDEDKCTSLRMSVYHPFFDQITKFTPCEPEPAAISSVKTLKFSMVQSRKTSAQRAASQNSVFVKFEDLPVSTV